MTENNITEVVNFFPITWNSYESEDSTTIRTFGLNENNESVFLKIINYKQYIYLELPPIEWTKLLIQSVVDDITEISGKNSPVKIVPVNMRKLYFSDNRKKPFLKCYFKNISSLKKMAAKFSYPVYIKCLNKKITLKVHEKESNIILQFLCNEDIKPSNWFKFKGEKVEESKKDSISQHEYEVHYKYKNDKGYEGSNKQFWKTEIDNSLPAKPLIMSVDIEVISSNPNKFPLASEKDDKIFQISAVIARNGDKETNYKKIILTLNKNKEGQIITLNVEKLGADIEVRGFSSEKKLLCGFTELIKEVNPQLIIGFNIFKFDIPYMYERACLLGIKDDFCNMSSIKDDIATLEKINWSSKAFGEQKCQYLSACGRLWVDMYPIIFREYKLPSYKLKSVAEHFLKDQTKDPLSVKGIFKCYRLFTSDSLAIVAKYCVVDSLVVLKLFEKLQQWIGLCEMSNTCLTPIFVLYTQGQQIRMYSQMYKECLGKFVIDSCSAEKVAAKEGEGKYTGAYVFTPTPGLYDNAISLDFCLTGDTLVSTTRGVSKKINTINCWDKLWVKDTNSVESGLIQDNPIGIKCNGIKPILKITMIDGRTIKCTPEHKFLSSSGEWVQASNLVSGIKWDGEKMIRREGTKLVMGLEQPEDIISDDEKGWSLIDHHMETEEDREKALAFARILGFVLADGWIGVRQIEACFGTLLDAKLFCDDVERITGKKSPIRDRIRDTEKGSTYTVNLLSEVAKQIISLEGIITGKRSTQKPSLPKFILEEACPKSIIREFLGGLFGGDGCAPYLSAGDNKIKSRFGLISLKWDIIEKFGKDMIKVMEKLCILAKKFDLDFKLLEEHKVKYTNENMKPKDVEENPRYSYIITLTHDDNLKFCEKIGFRYCLYKSCRLTVAASHQRLSDNVRRQHDLVYNNGKGIKNLEETKKYFFKNEVPLNEYYSTIYYKNRNVNNKLRLERKYFPDPITYVDTLGVRDWFAGFGQSHKKVYCVSREDTHVPTFSMEVADVREVGEEMVYDIVEIRDHHNFLANGVATHQCSLYPSTMIAYNLDYSSMVLDEKVQEDKCHHLQWTDHNLCPHDTKKYPKKQERTQECTQACIKRDFRFLKEPEGTLPRILRQLLERRKQTKKELKQIEKRLDEIEDESSEEYKNLERLAVVLDKRQNAYKIVANSGYGATGATKGYLPMLPIAMCTTYMGRVSIEKASKHLVNHYKANLIYGDSVTGYTPIYVRSNGIFDICTIESLAEKYGNGIWLKCEEYGKQEKEYYEFDDINIETWTKDGWTRLKRIIRHQLDPSKKIIRVNTHTGMVDATDDHSFMDKNRNKISPKDMKIGEELLHNEHPNGEDVKCSIGEEEAMIMGFFMGDGSCGEYDCKSGNKCSWALNNASPNLLKKYLELCKKVYINFEWVIMDTIESSGVYKISPRNINKKTSLNNWIRNYRDKMYYKKSKIIPTEILNATENIRRAFFNGLYDADGDKDINGYVRIDQKNQISASHICWLASSLGYKTSINIRSDKENIYRSMTKTKQRKNPIAIKKMIELNYQGYVYDLTTENHQFAAGIGKLIVHNTDSCYINFPDYLTKESCQSLDKHCRNIEKETENFFPPPMKLCYEEKIYYRYLILTKKRYMGLEYDLKTDKLKEKISMRGVLLARRDNAKFMKDFYSKIIMSSFYREKEDKIYDIICDGIRNLLLGYISAKDLTVNKSVGDISSYAIRNLPQDDKKLEKRLLELHIEGVTKDAIKKKSIDLNKIREIFETRDYSRYPNSKETAIVEEYYSKALPAQVQLAEKMRSRGKNVDVGERIPYILLDSEYGNKAKVSDKIEDIEYFIEHKSSLKIDYFYYLDLFQKPFDEILTTCYKKDDIFKTIIKYRENYLKVLNQIKELFKNKIIFT